MCLHEAEIQHMLLRHAVLVSFFCFCKRIWCLSGGRFAVPFFLMLSSYFSFNISREKVSIASSKYCFDNR